MKRTVLKTFVLKSDLQITVYNALIVGKFKEENMQRTRLQHALLRGIGQCRRQCPPACQLQETFMPLSNLSVRGWRYLIFGSWEVEIVIYGISL